jgi:hypothetical protein
MSIDRIGLAGNGVMASIKRSAGPPGNAWCIRAGQLLTSSAAPAASVEGALRFAVPVVLARHLPSMLRALPEVLGPERVADLAARARVHVGSTMALLTATTKEVTPAQFMSA